MLKVRMDTDRLSLEELENISTALRGPCLDCIEYGVPESCRHPGEIRRLLHSMADAIDFERGRREKRDRELALGVDPESGEWVAGA